MGTTSVGFEEQLWQAADKLRSNMDAAEYKHVVLGLIFLKYVSDSFAEMIEPFEGQIFDPACGSGGMFCQSARFVKEHQGNVRDISIFGQESNPTTWKLARMNLAIRGLEANLGKHNADSFHDDQHKTLKANYILANPPLQYF